MLDVGDYEVVDECEGEDEDEVISYDGNEEEHIDEDGVDINEDKQNAGNNEDYSNVDENSGDNTENILDVSIDMESDFLESVAKDFSVNIEEDEDRPRVTRSSTKRREPTVQLRKLDMSTKKTKAETEVTEVPRKKPGPKSKTMNVPTPPVKRVIQRITFSDKSGKEDNKKNQKDSKGESQKTPVKAPLKNSSVLTSKDTTAPPQKNSNAAPPKKIEQSTPKDAPKKSVFLKADLTDEEIMMHFDEIENTVLTSDTFVIQEEVDQALKEEKKDGEDSSQPNDTNNEKNQEEKKNDNEEEDWDKDVSPPKRKTEFKIEEEELKESEMWYKEKVSLIYKLLFTLW